MKIILYARLTGVLFVDFDMTIYTFNRDGTVKEINFGIKNSKKQYDGTHIFTIDVSKIECYELIEVSITWGFEYITFYNLTVEYQESFPSIDYKSLKNAISKYIY